MSENGEPKRSVTGDVLSLLEDQVELASLELEYEMDQAVRRLGALVVGAFLGLTAFAILQIAIVSGLERLGLSLAQASLILAAVYGIVGATLIMKFGRRDKLAGAPFQGTLDEVRKNLRWIRKFLS